MDIPIPSLNLMAVAPEILVLVTALLVMLADLFLSRAHKGRLAWLSLVGVILAAGLALYTLSDVGPARAGGGLLLQDMFVADAYALFLKLVILAAAALAILFSVEYAGRVGLPQGEYYMLFLLSTAGMMLMAGAANLMAIFLALEIMSIALYILVGLNRAQQRSGEAALKYLLLGAFASAFLLYGIALAYGQVGSTSLVALRDHVLSLNTAPALLLVGLGLMLVGLGFKVALVPFHMWAPDVYAGAPTSVTAYMSAGVKVAGFAVLGRVLVVAFGDLHGTWIWALAILSVLTMTVGNLAALRQSNLKRMLAYSSVAHAGYILVGLAAGTPFGVSAVLFYLFVYVFMTAAAFAVLMAIGRFSDLAEGEMFDDIEGMGARQPWVAALMTLLMLSLAGVPPLAGFFAKLWVFGAAVQADLAWLAVIGVVNSVISAYYYLRVVAAIYFGRQESSQAGESHAGLALRIGLALSAMAIVVFGVWPSPILDLARSIAESLLGS